MSEEKKTRQPSPKDRLENPFDVQTVDVILIFAYVRKSYVSLPAFCIGFHLLRIYLFVVYFVVVHMFCILWTTDSVSCIEMNVRKKKKQRQRLNEWTTKRCSIHNRQRDSDEIVYFRINASAVQFRSNRKQNTSHRQLRMEYQSRTKCTSYTEVTDPRTKTTTKNINKILVKWTNALLQTLANL